MKRVLLAAPVLLLCGCADLARLKLLAPTAFDMEQIAPAIYVDSAASAEAQGSLRNAVAEAQVRVARVFGDATTEPKVFACSTEDCFRRFGGSTNRANSLGDYGLLLSPRGLTAALIAHEWSHVELYARAGGLWTMRRIPKWFDEGLAVAVSEEPTHAQSVCDKARKDAVPLPELAALATSSQWLDAVKAYRNPALNPKNLAIVYATAGCAVRPWLARHGSAGLRSLIERVRSGEDFDAVYAVSIPSENGPIHKPAQFQ